MEVATLSASRIQRRSLGDRLRRFLHVLRLSIMESLDCFRGMSPTFICFTLLVLFFESYVQEYWKGPESITSHILVFLGSRYSLYSIYSSHNRQIHHRVTLNVSTFSSLLFVDLPYVLAYIDLELRPSLFTSWGLISFIICCSTLADILISNGCSRHSLQTPLYSQLYCQSFLRSLVFFGLIVVGCANIIEKTWNSDLVFHKHVLVPLSLYIFAFIQLHEKYSMLTRMREMP